MVLPVPTGVKAPAVSTLRQRDSGIARSMSAPAAASVVWFRRGAEAGG
jgi:hypothetical protein